MSENISISDFQKLPEDEAIFYNSNNEKTTEPIPGITVKYYSKYSKIDLDKIMKKKEAQIALDAQTKISRLETIRITPDIPITIEEYNFLPPDKFGFEWSPYYYRNEHVGYIKGRSVAQIALDAQTKIYRFETIKKTPGISITIEEYKSLPPDKFGFEWSPYYSRNEHVGYIKGRSIAEIDSDASRLDREIAQIILKSRISPEEHLKLSSEQQKLFRPDIANQTEYQKYHGIYDYLKNNSFKFENIKE
jgi:hypothetical protein